MIEEFTLPFSMIQPIKPISGVMVTIEPQEETPSLDAAALYSVICWTLNVRSGPGTQYERIGTLSRDTAIEVLEVQNGWYKIVFQGGMGYVSSIYVA